MASTTSIASRAITSLHATHPALNVTLLLLHGTGGNEHDLLTLGHELLPGAALLSPRGGVLENGMPRFFRRFAQGVFDDLKFQTHELNEFVKRASEDYPIHKNRTIAVGYSNGANIAASLVLHVEAREIRSFPAA